MASTVFDQLSPFISITLTRHPEGPSGDQVGQCLDDVKQLCAADPNSAVSDFKYREPREGSAGVMTAAMSYKRTLSASWTEHPDVKDTVNHLVVATAYKGHLALHVTDPKLKGPIRSALIDQANEAKPLSWLLPITRATLAAAFLVDGQAKTLWLTGIHRRAATKADAKVLAGQDLDYSLDPFDDQSFYWSAARSRSASLEITVGVSPKHSRVWIAKATSLGAFESAAATVINALLAAKPSGEEPFRFLAIPLDKLDPTEVEDAYDLSVIPPDMIADGEDDADQVNQDAALLLETDFAAKRAAPNSANVDVTALLNGNSLGTLTLEVALSADGKAKLKASNALPSGLDDDKFNRLKTLIGRGHGVNIRYDSAHTISDKQVYSTRPSRVPFSQYEAKNFSGYDVSKEKPADMTNIGGEDSLFCWVKNSFSGWLACDDGANEKADFINLAVKDGKQVLTLIHVKGANSQSANRQISVAAYEVVTGQAVKNLQWLDKVALAKGVEESVRASNYFWHDGAPAPKADLVSAIAALGDDFVRQVLIVQPHVISKAHSAATKAKSGKAKLRLDQLNTLLANASRGANGLGVEFKVIWSD